LLDGFKNLRGGVDGVYRAGFATTQEAYEKAVKEVFESLDKVEKLLTGKDYIIGDRLTEADIRLWVTIVRSLFRTAWSVF
jgi:Predicted glutathione S-transferase